jgi:epoxyqueuosine reductase
VRTLAGRVKERARELDFSMAGIAPARPSPELDAYLRWVRAGMHGEMGYMAREDREARRRDLNVVLPEARSLVVVGLDYFSLKLPEAVASDPARGRISNYAWGVDYHDVMLARLKELARFLEDAAGPVAARAYVDTGASPGKTRC